MLSGLFFFSNAYLNISQLTQTLLKEQLKQEFPFKKLLLFLDYLFK